MTFQTYPPPTTLPPLRAGGEPDALYLDCTPGLAPIGDTFAGIPALTITRINGEPLDVDDLVSAGAVWPDAMDTTNRIPTYGFLAPPGSAGRTYRLTISGSTAQGRLFVRDWIVSVLPWMG